MSEQKSAFIAIVGRPNVGKSSILNRILGQKVAIVSSKPQTTRNRIIGVHTNGDTQVVFIDTPGLHKPHNSLGEYMVRSVNESVGGVDACLLTAECNKLPGDTEKQLIARFKAQNIPAVLALNKIDKLSDKSELMAIMAAYSQEYDFDDIVPVSAQTGSGINDLLKALEKQSSEGVHFFDDDALTDQPDRVLAAEIVREKILRLTDKEIPHGAAVVVERFKQREESDAIDIDATIFCERENHKGIIIGKGGAMLKKIGTFARQDMERFFGCKVNLRLWVKVKEGWRDREDILRAMGFDSSNFA
ncbi:MAG: GTPase Era [Clostridia bacterium]|nr:GTPase Era [Clostridia bacterium]